MTVWNTIDTAPLDTLVLLRKDFEEVETPIVVIGEVIEFKGKTHHLWRGGYDQTIKSYPFFDPDESGFTHWAELGDLV